MAGRSKREPFSPADAVWLHIDTPTNMAMIAGVLMLDRPLDIGRFKEVLEHRLLRLARFRQRVREPLLAFGLPSWEVDPHFDLNAHVHHIALPHPGDVTALQTLVGDLMGTPLDFTKPLWQLHVVDDCSGGGALICRLHHCIADGLALVQVLLSLASADREASLLLPEAEARHDDGLLIKLLRPVAGAVSWTTRSAGALVQEGWETLLDPARMLAPARVAIDGTAALGKLLLTPPDSKTIFRGQCGVTKRAVWSAPLPLAEVKDISHSLGCTINDLLLAAVAGALRRYLEGRGQPTERLNIRAMVPVSLRRPEDMDDLGNQFGLVILSLPVGVRDPQVRLAVLKGRMDAIKNSPEAVVAFGILNATGLTPIQVEKIIVDIFAAKVSAVMTNVPGPREPLYLAGSLIKDLMFWVPSPGGAGMGISILSYAGNVMVGVATDAGLVPDPEAIVEGFHAELAEMRSHPAPAAQGDVVETTADGDGRCQALTAAGRQCRNHALPGGTTCRVHAGKG
jgi:diacylglycerol O-acyltransferase